MPSTKSKMATPLGSTCVTITANSTFSWRWSSLNFASQPSLQFPLFSDQVRLGLLSFGELLLTLLQNLLKLGQFLDFQVEVARQKRACLLRLFRGDRTPFGLELFGDLLVERFSRLRKRGQLGP